MLYQLGNQVNYSIYVLNTLLKQCNYTSVYLVKICKKPIFPQIRRYYFW